MFESCWLFVAFISIFDRCGFVYIVQSCYGALLNHTSWCLCVLSHTPGFLVFISMIGFYQGSHSGFVCQ